LARCRNAGKEICDLQLARVGQQAPAVEHGVVPVRREQQLTRAGVEAQAGAKALLLDAAAPLPKTTVQSAREAREGAWRESAHRSGWCRCRRWPRRAPARVYAAPGGPGWGSGVGANIEPS